jgi:hypothetical protein
LALGWKERPKDISEKHKNKNNLKINKFFKVYGCVNAQFL